MGTDSFLSTGAQIICKRLLLSSGSGEVIEKELRRLLYRIPESLSDILELSYTHQVAAGLIRSESDSVFVDHDEHEVDCGGKTPLHWAAYTANTPALRGLLRARANVKAQDYYGNTALHMAVNISGKGQRCAELLLLAGSDVLTKDRDGWQAIHFAAIQDNTEMLDILVPAGADIHTRNNDGCSPLQWACIRDKAENVTALLAAGANIDGRDNDGDTPLFDAIHNGHAKVVQLLLSNGAGFEHQNNYGHTILHILALYGTLGTIAPFMSETLELGNLDVDTKDNQGHTAWEALQDRPAPPEGFVQAFEVLLAMCKAQRDERMDREQAVEMEA